MHNRIHKVIAAVWVSIVVVTVTFTTTQAACAADWPMWRYDSNRSAATPDALPKQLQLQWVRELPATRPAWPASQTKLQFDLSYAPIVVGQLMVVGSNVDDSVTAFDTKTGAEVWRFFTNGPVRFAPAAHAGRLYAVSDDGWLYCLDATNGTLVWKVNGGPTNRPIIGNGRLISSWPARGGAVVADGVVYFTASIWPSMGVFVHAVAADSGRVLWTNSETGAQFLTHPHGAKSFGAIAPQGYLAMSGDYLVVPGGRTMPAVFDRKTGKLLHFEFGGKGGSGSDGIMATDQFYVLRNVMLRTSDGASLGTVNTAVLGQGRQVGSAGSSGPIQVRSLAGKIGEGIVTDRRGRKSKQTTFVPDEQWQFTPAGHGQVFLTAGDVVYAASGNQIASYDLKVARQNKSPQEAVWTADIEGTVSSMLAGDEKLFVVTKEARIYCFGIAAVLPKTLPVVSKPLRLAENLFVEPVAAMLNSSGKRGYAIAMGIGSGTLIAELLKQSEMHVIAVDPDADKVAEFRRRTQQAGLYGTRVSARVGGFLSQDFPPYLANLIVSEEPTTAGVDVSSDAFVSGVFRTLRPYGGAAFLPMPMAEHTKFRGSIDDARLKSFKLDRADTWTTLTRVGALPDAGSWTHQYGDAANSVVSADKLVKAPLGLLWFGGPSNDKVLPRHGHGPSPQIAGGRLFIEGPDMLRCVDVYTGRVWWEKELAGLGKFYDNTGHQPGAGEIGSNYVSLPDNIYVVYGSEILELDAATGELTKDFNQDSKVDGTKPFWGFIAAEGDLLIATSSPVAVNETPKSPKPATPAIDQILRSTQYSSASRKLVIFNRKTGKQLWSRDAEFGFRHNCIAVAAGKVFCIDGMSPKKLETLKRRGIDASGKARLLALDANTGKEIWSTNKDVFGTFLNYSVEYDVLVQAGSAYRDRARDEVGQGIVAYKGRDGRVLWKNLDLSHGGPCLLWHDKIITNGGGGFQLELLTGKTTGWSYRRMYGCNTAVGSEHLLTFRSGAAGFFDLENDSGTGNLGGFKSSCTANLIVADGVLNAPDYTRTCSCAYQNQTSLAMIHMPEAEFWTFSNFKFDDEPIQRVGLNFGAPGDRRANDQTLWLDYPSVGGPSPELDVTVNAPNPQWFRHHSSKIRGEGHSWVAASGGKGILSVTMTLSPDSKQPRPYTVRLHFIEPDDVKPGDRVFSIALQGQPVLKDFDVAKSAGGRYRAIVKEFKRVGVKSKLEVALTPSGGFNKTMPVLCGIEVIAESPRQR